MPSHTATKTLNAWVQNGSWTHRTSVFFLGAEIRNDSFNDLPAFTSSRNPARTLHDRLEMHFGTESAQVVHTTGAVGEIPSGSSVEDALRYLWGLVSSRESFWGSRFSIDAYCDELVFWRDLFGRVVADALGRSSGLHTTFGDFNWQTLLLDGATVSVDGDEAVLGGETALADFIGYPTMTQGELWFDFYFDLATNPWKISIQPSRDDVTDLEFWVRARRILSTMYLEWGIGELGTHLQAFSGSARWMRVHIAFGVPGDTATINVTPVGFDEEPTSEVSGTVPDPNTGHRWIAMGVSGDTSYSDDGVTWTFHSIAGAGSNFSAVCFGMAFGVPTWMAGGSVVGIYWTRDLVTWTQVTTAHSPSGTLPGFSTVATDGAGTWVACNISQTTPWRAIGDPATSFWNRQTTSLPHAIWAISYGNGLFIAVTSFGDLATSPDGGTWTNRTTGLNPSDDWLQDAPAYGNGLWVAVGGGGAGANEFMSLTSPDGTTWTSHFITPALDDYYGMAIAYGEGLFVVVGLVGLIVTSPDGVNWTLNDQGIAEDLNDVSFADGVWVAVPLNGNVYEADDPTGTWTLRTTGDSNGLLTVLGRPQRTGFGTPVLHFEQTESDQPHLVDNMKTTKADADAARIYHAIAMDAEVAASGGSGSLTLNAIAKKKLTQTFTENALVKKNRSSSYTLDAIAKKSRSSSFTINCYIGVPPVSFTLNGWVKANRTGSFTLNGIVKKNRTGSFTLDAYVGTTGESGLLGDHTLAQHELGGG